MPLFTLGAGSLKMCFHQFHQLLSQVRINYDSWLHHINAASLTSPANLIDLSRISGSLTHSKRQVSTDFAACHPLRNISRLAPIAAWVRNTYPWKELNWLVAPRSNSLDIQLLESRSQDAWARYGRSSPRFAWHLWL